MFYVIFLQKNNKAQWKFALFECSGGKPFQINSPKSTKPELNITMFYYWRNIGFLCNFVDVSDIGFINWINHWISEQKGDINLLSKDNSNTNLTFIVLNLGKLQILRPNIYIIQRYQISEGIKGTAATETPWKRKSKVNNCRTKSTWTKRTAHRQKVFGQKVPGIGQKVPDFIKNVL